MSSGFSFQHGAEVFAQPLSFACLVSDRSFVPSVISWGVLMSSNSTPLSLAALGSAGHPVPLCPFASHINSLHLLGSDFCPGYRLPERSAASRRSPFPTEPRLTLTSLPTGPRALIKPRGVGVRAEAGAGNVRSLGGADPWCPVPPHPGLRL